jgi:hypothetical protein
MAEKMGITLIGYVRREIFAIYSHPERILISTFADRILVRQNDQ